jgi:peroxiredoxin
MKKAIKILVLLPVVILAGVLVLGALGGGEKTRKRQARPSIGEPARDFTYPGLDGRDVSLSDYYGTKVVFVNIWATWCTECKKELPTVQALYERFRGEDFEVLAVSIDALGEKAVAPFMKEMGLTFPALLDTAGSVQLLYGTTGVPESFIIDKKGRVAFVEIGAGDWREPEKQALVQSLVSETSGTARAEAR